MKNIPVEVCGFIWIRKNSTIGRGSRLVSEKKKKDQQDAEVSFAQNQGSRASTVKRSESIR
jgi:hypothetical protein